MNELFMSLFNKYGLATAATVYILKTLWDIFRGQTAKYIKAIDANTEAINKLRADLQVAFLNIRELRDKTGMGPLSRPNIDQ